MRQIALVACVLSLIVLPNASAQSIFATLSGTVRDSSGAVIPGAEVTVTNVSSGTPNRSTTNRDGFFSFASLPAPGTYEVNVAMKGFAGWVTKNVQLHASDSRSLNIELKVATTTESVEVVTGTEGVAMVDSGEKAYTIQTKDLQELSLVGRNASELVKILPGATLTANGGINSQAYTGEVVGLNSSLGGQTGGLASVMINGQAAEITQDGQRTMDPGAFGTATPIVPNPDMISEVKVLTSNFTAENAQGPVVMNSVTQSGGKAFHGNLRFNARNTALNSEQQYYREQEMNPGNNLKPGQLKPASSYYYPGFSIGGPVIIPGTGLNKSRQKLFFFDGFEYYKQQIDGGVESAFVPTPAMLNGDFSALTGSGNTGGRNTVYAKPVTPQPCVASGTNPCASGWYGMAERPGCVITNGVLNPACIDPAAQTLMKLETPASTSDSISGNNYIQSFSVAQNSFQNMVRGDWNISDNTKAYVTWNRHRETNNMPLGLWATTCAWCVPSPTGVVGNNGADNYTATFLHVFSPTMTAEGKFGYMKLNLPSAPTDPKKIQRSESGFPLKGYYDTANLPAVLSWGDSIPSFGDVGHSYHPTMIAVKGIPSVTANVTKVIGTHTTKYGFYWEHLYNKQDNWGQYMGVFQYASWSGSPTGNEYADMLMGMGQAGYFEQAQPPASEVAQNIASFYAQDDWRLNRRITVQVGMRFEHVAKPYSPGFGLALFDPARYDAAGTGNTGVVWHGSDHSVPLSGVDSRFVYFSPRLGAAIDLFGNGRTVVRGGWGKFRAYDSVQANSYTGPAQTALGSVGFGCGSNDPACPTWEDIDLHNSNNCTAGVNCAPKAVFGNPQLVNGSFNAMLAGDDEQPLVTSYSLNVDQQLPAKFTLEMSYVGNHSDFQQGTVNINGIPLGTLAGSCNNATCEQPFRPFNKYQNVTGSVTSGKAQFDSMQLSLQRNVGYLSLQANYTWSKALSEGSNLNNGSLMGALPDYGAHFLYGISPSNRKHAFSTAYVFRIPDAHSSSRFLNGLANGWEISGITQIESGAQITNQASGNGLLFGYNPDNVAQLGTPDAQQYPLITCDPLQGLQKNQFANPNCFTTPPPGSLGTGSAPYLPGPMFWNTDITLLKHVKITEHQKLEFRFAAFNPLNHSLLSFISSDNNLKLNFDSNGKASPTFGTATAHYGVRILELGVKYLF